MRVHFAQGNTAFVVLPLLLALGGCSLAPFDEEGTFRQTATRIGMTGKLPEDTPAFIRDKRPEATDYQPVGVTPTRGSDPRTVAGVQDLEKQLRAKQSDSVQQAARPVPKSPYDGKIEPGFKPPPPPPMPEGKAPEIGLRGAQPTAAAAATAPAKTSQKTQEPRKRPKQQDGETDH